jgi:protein-disulfide isomerase
MRTKFALVLVAGLMARVGLAEEPPGTVAVVGGQPVSEAEFRSAAGNRLIAVETQAFQGKERLLNEFIDKRLLEKEASSRSVTVEALEAAEVDGKVKPATDAEITTVKDQNKERLAGVPEAQATQAVRDAILNQHRVDRRGEFVQELREKANVRILIEAPRVTVAEADTPALGPKAAPVTIIEFSDFECPYCAQAAPILKQVREAYGDKVRFVYRDYPLSIHAHAGKAAEAGACAREQGKFWEMHDKLFADQGHLTVPDLKNDAKVLGLDTEAFDACLDSSRYEPTWKAQAQDGEKYGVTGTPFFFVNGRMLNGMVPLATMRTLIDEELRRAASAQGAKKTPS